MSLSGRRHRSKTIRSKFLKKRKKSFNIFNRHPKSSSTNVICCAKYLSYQNAKLTERSNKKAVFELFQKYKVAQKTFIFGSGNFFDYLSKILVDFSIYYFS